MTEHQEPVALATAPVGCLLESSDYGAWYYAHYSVAAYDPAEPYWQSFFGDVASRIVETFRPTSSLDAGCAMGVLVGSLRERGVDAEGVDLSAYAIEQADPRAQGHVCVGSLADPLTRRYDIITCIEVLEHIDAGRVEAVVANLCSATDTVLLSTTPDDFNEGTHVNVRPPSYWCGLFADQGFHRRFDVDASFISPWAVVLHRRQEPLRVVVVDYETALWNLRRENIGTRAAVIERDRQLAELGEHLKQVTASLADADVQRTTEVTQERLRTEEADRRAQAAASQAQLAQTRVEQITGSTSYRMASAAARAVRRVPRPGGRGTDSTGGTPEAPAEPATDATHGSPPPPVGTA
ncbi:MAG: class I SAM-dependent methyltransferase [Candidatus Nanopelagicales bacterium]